MTAWPLVGREAELSRLAATLTGAGGPLVVSGPAGVGKTRLVAQARERARRAAVHMHWAVCTPTGVPFAPFAHFLAAPAGTGPDALTATLSRTAARLLSAGPRAALVVDDAHLLDPASAALVAHLVTNTPLPVALTARDPLPDWPWLRELDRLELGPLGPDEVREAVHRFLGEPAEAALCATLVRLSQGNPLLLRELVQAAHATRAVVCREGVWCAARPLVAADSLPGQVSARLAGLAVPVRAAAELIALVEPAPPELLERVLDRSALAGVEAEGLLVGTGGEVGLVHPLYSEALRAATPPLRGRDHRRRLADAAERYDPVRYRLSAAIWRLDGGLPVAAATLIEAARLASRALDHALAGRLAEAAVLSAPPAQRFEAELVLLGELPYQGRTEQALQRAGELADVVTGARERAELARLRATLYLVAGQPAAARDTLDGAIATIDDPGLRAGLEVSQAAQAFTTGQVGLCLELGDRVLARYPDQPGVMARLAIARVRALACVGRTADACAFARAALDSLDPADAGDRATGATIEMTLLQALAMDGQLTAAAELGTAGMTRASHGPAVALRAYWANELGQLDVLAGRPEPARRWLRETLAVMPLQALPASLQLWGLDGLTEAAALLGDAADAATQARRLRDTLPPGFRPVRRGGAVWALAAAGDVASARDLALRYAHELTTAGVPLMAAWLLHDAVRLGAGRAAASPLADLASRCQGRLVPAMAANAAALAANDPDRLVAAAGTLTAIGCELYAAESSTRAATLLRRAGRPVPALDAAAHAERYLGGARTPLLRERVPELDALTGREREVASLAAHGLSDRDIAARLHLSVRTINSHLYRAYHKLGVADRSQLPDTL